MKGEGADLRSAFTRMGLPGVVKKGTDMKKGKRGYTRIIESKADGEHAQREYERNKYGAIFGDPDRYQFAYQASGKSDRRRSDGD